jgi:hypothetical protein
MRNLIIDGAAGGETKICHDVTFTLHRGKDRVHFSTGFFQKENIVYPGVLQIFLRTSGILHYGISFCGTLYFHTMNFNHGGKDDR